MFLSKMNIAGMEVYVAALYSQSKVKDFFNASYPTEIREMREFVSKGGLIFFQHGNNFDMKASFTAIDGQPVISVYTDGPNMQKTYGGVFHHEFIHFKQWERGDLRFGETKAYWKGKEVDLSLAAYSRTTQPWEKEAWDKEDAINAFYAQYIPSKKRKKFLGVF